MIYLINKINNEVVTTFNNVIEWSTDYVLLKSGQGRAKYFSNENEYFTDTLPDNILENKEEK